MDIYFLDINKISDSDFEMYYSLCSDERKKRIDKATAEDEKKRLIGSEILIRHVFPESEVWRTESGKPVCNIDGVFFSLSHSNELCAIAISDAPCGIDVEVIRPLKESVLNRFYSAEEKAYVLASANKDEAFFKIWTRKEALLKAADLDIPKLRNLFVKDATVAYNTDTFCLDTFCDNGYIISTCKKNLG